MTATAIFPGQGRLAAISVVALLALVASCASPPPQSDQPPGPTISTGTATRTPDKTLDLPASPYGTEFTAAETALADFDWMSASVALADLPDEELGSDDYAYLQYLLARISHVRGLQHLALSQLQVIPRQNVHPAITYRIDNFKRALLGQRGDHLQSARLGVTLMKVAPAEHLAGLKRSVWRDLSRLDDMELQGALTAAEDPGWHAWLELADISRRDLDEQSVTLPDWLAANPGHPAAEPLPGGLEFLAGATSRTTKIALLLPVSGRLAPAGKAVRDGFLASYYQDRAARAAGGEVLVLDSDRYESARDAYNDAVHQGAEIVVGPLSKVAVAELATLPSRPVPVLALNQTDAAVNPAGSALVQLSLAPEDEATGIAELAFGHGARRALILRPAGSWGDKMERALSSRWRELGGQVAASVSYTGRDDYSASLKSGLGIDGSETRRQRLRDMLATNVEFTARRRQDLDVVFLLGRNGPEARSLKPLLAFHYAGGLPVYAPSSIYTGSPDARDRDLNGINLVEIPWLLGSNPALKAELAAAPSDQYSRLNALGADAFRVQSRFRQLQAGPDALIRGDTGLLSMNSRLQIVRELPAATFDGGELTSR